MIEDLVQEVQTAADTEEAAIALGKKMTNLEQEINLLTNVNDEKCEKLKRELQATKEKREDLLGHGILDLLKASKTKRRNAICYGTDYGNRKLEPRKNPNSNLEQEMPENKLDQAFLDLAQGVARLPGNEPIKRNHGRVGLETEQQLKSHKEMALNTLAESVWKPKREAQREKEKAEQERLKLLEKMKEIEAVRAENAINEDRVKEGLPPLSPDGKPVQPWQIRNLMGENFRRKEAGLPLIGFDGKEINSSSKVDSKSREEIRKIEMLYKYANHAQFNPKPKAKFSHMRSFAPITRKKSSKRSSKSSGASSSSPPSPGPSNANGRKRSRMPRLFQFYQEKMDGDSDSDSDISRARSASPFLYVGGRPKGKKPRSKSSGSSKSSRGRSKGKKGKPKKKSKKKKSPPKPIAPEPVPQPEDPVNLEDHHHKSSLIRQVFEEYDRGHLLELEEYEEGEDHELSLNERCDRCGNEGELFPWECKNPNGLSKKQKRDLVLKNLNSRLTI